MTPELAYYLLKETANKTYLLGVCDTHVRCEICERRERGFVLV